LAGMRKQRPFADGLGRMVYMDPRTKRLRGSRGKGRWQGLKG
jgi:hypothetical protein